MELEKYDPQENEVRGWKFTRLAFAVVQRFQPGARKEEDWQITRKIELKEKVLIISNRKSMPQFWIALIPALIAALISIIGLLVGIHQFNAQQASNAQLQSAQQATAAAQSLDQERQSTFETYLDRMSDLLLIDNLQTSQPGSAVRAIAEARTFVTLRDLDPFRRAQLVRFLWKAGLDTGNQPVISLDAAPLNPSFFQHALLGNINFSGALLNKSTFDDCDLHGANFKEAELPGVLLNNVNLTGANLSHVNLYGATLSEATLTGANFSWSSLQYANLSGDDLTHVNLTAANLEGANLQGAKITAAQLNQIATLKGAILPDGSRHP